LPIEKLHTGILSNKCEDKGKVVPEESQSWDELIVDDDDCEDPEIFEVVL